MKPFLTLLIASCLTLQAETEKEFGERVAKAWNSKNSAEILALYGDPAKLDPDFKNQLTTGIIDVELKNGLNNVDVTLLPPNPDGSKTVVTNGKIMYPQSKATGRVKISFVRDATSKIRGGGLSVDFSKTPNGAFALVSPAVKTFEWTGGDPTSFNVRLKSDKEGAFIPQAMMVVERYGHIEWLTIGDNTSFGAHKLISLIVSTTPDTESITVEITSGREAEPTFKKTVNTSKGAIIPIESLKP